MEAPPDGSAEAAGLKCLSLLEPLQDLKLSAFGTRVSLEIPRNVKANVEHEWRSLRDWDALFCCTFTASEAELMKAGDRQTLEIFCSIKQQRDEAQDVWFQNVWVQVLMSAWKRGTYGEPFRSLCRPQCSW